MNPRRPSRSSRLLCNQHEIGTADFTVPLRPPSGRGIGRRPEATTRGLWRSAATPIRSGQRCWRQRHISPENKSDDFQPEPIVFTLFAASLSWGPAKVAPTEKMQMQMKYRLARSAPIVHNGSVAPQQLQVARQLRRDQL